MTTKNKNAISDKMNEALDSMDADFEKFIEEMDFKGGDVLTGQRDAVRFDFESIGDAVAGTLLKVFDFDGDIEGKKVINTAYVFKPTAIKSGTNILSEQPEYTHKAGLIKGNALPDKVLIFGSTVLNNTLKGVPIGTDILIRRKADKPNKNPNLEAYKDYDILAKKMAF